MKQTNKYLLAGAGLAVLLASGCGQAGSSSTSPRAASPSIPAGTIHEVRMRGDASGFYFEPKEITIARGDIVRWKMVDGAPHNVNFSGQTVPQGAQIVLENKKKLLGLMLAVPGQTYEIHFTDDFPLGEYNYVCDPHIVLNMTGKLTITDNNSVSFTSL